MKKFTSKTGLVLLGVMVVAIAAAIGAYAYFTSTGSGTGTATVGTDSAWQLNQTNLAGGPLYPDAAIGTGNIETAAYTVKNPSLGTTSRGSRRTRPSTRPWRRLQIERVGLAVFGSTASGLGRSLLRDAR